VSGVDPGPEGPLGAGDEVDLLTGPEAEELLRPAAELAIELARAGARLQPPQEVPKALLPLLGHVKVTRAALATARRVVESDPVYRARLTAATQLPAAPATLGPAGMLWLSRPEGWQAELGSLVAEARAAATARAEEAGERSATRRLRHAEQAREGAEQAAEAARASAEAARHELQEERRLRRSADEAVAQARRHAASLEEQLRAAHRQAAAAAQRSTEQAEAAAEAAAAVAAADTERRALRSEVEALHLAAAVVPPAPASPSGPTAELAGVGEAVAAASSAALALSAALARAAGALQPATRGDSGPPNPPVRPPVVDLPPAPRPATRPRWVRAQRRGARRRPAGLPPLLLDDSPAAARHLVGLPGVAVLVDGYNATLTAWPELPLAEQRLRLVDALSELAARTGARPEVVFDGDEVGPSVRSDTSPRSLVRVSFTASDVEADDILIARAGTLPLPVVVASDDRRVRDGARSAGANVVSVAQLLAVLHRKSG
jgi:predicted RNA-binding protein with PIN domain